MGKIMPKEIQSAVRSVLENARRGRPFLTAYQILDRIDQSLRSKLISERGRGGKRSGRYYSAASLVSRAARMLPDVETECLDVSDMELWCASEQLEPGNPQVGLYRLKR